MGDTGGRKPREGYICRACGSDAHHINDCLVANQRPPGGDRYGARGKRGPQKEIGRESAPSVLPPILMLTVGLCS